MFRMAARCADARQAKVAAATAIKKYEEKQTNREKHIRMEINYTQKHTLCMGCKQKAENRLNLTLLRIFKKSVGHKRQIISNNIHLIIIL